jgi:hypothetical protein
MPRPHEIALVLALAGASPSDAIAQQRGREERPTVQIVRVGPADHFDWGDAGIGAAGGAGLSLVAVGGGLVVAGMRHPTNREDP